jgi:competence protein ComEC
MLRWAIPFLAGAALLHALPALGPAESCVVPALAALVLRRRAPALAAACAGFALTHGLATERLATAWPCERDRETASVEGRIAAPPVTRAGRIEFDLDVVRLDAPGPSPRRLRVSWYEPDRSPAVGEEWRFELRLRCRRGFQNPGAPERELTLLRERIDATAYVLGKRPPVRIGPAATRPIERLRERISGAIAAALPPGPSVAVLQGLAVGVRGAIPDRLWEAFSATGIAHLMAISGLHVTGCALFVLAGLRRFARLPAIARLPVRVSGESIVVVTVSAGYALLAGASLPALRTVAMVALLAALRILRRSWPVDRVLALAAVLLVATDPLALTSVGFWLSFVATAALIAAALRGGSLRARLLGFARGQLAVTALLTPVLAIGFGRLSLVSPLVNALAIPLFGLLLPIVLAGTVVAAASPELSVRFWRALAPLLDGTWPWLEAIASWSGASWAPALQPLALVAAVTVALFVALLVPLAGIRFTAAALVAALCLGRPEPLAEGAFRLVALDVGQGLAVVTETRGHALVFDTGPAWPGGGAAAQVSLLPYLRARGIRAIDRLIVSHEDRDHAGGVERLREAMPVRAGAAAWGSEVPPQEDCRRGATWRWDGVTFRVLHPPAGFAGDDNDLSCAILVSGPAGRALLLADPESRGEAELLTQEVAADVVLLPHHGSRTSSQAALVGAVSARYGIASAGFGNRWGMPHREVVARWRSFGTSVLATAKEGAVIARFTPERDVVEITSARRVARRWWRQEAENQSPRAAGAPARYHAAPCGKSSSRAARSCGRSSSARWSPRPSCWSDCGLCSPSASSRAS